MKSHIVATVLVAVLAGTSAWGARASAAPSAEQILEACGIQGGLIVHIGCGKGELTTALHGGGPYVVQGLDADPDNVAEAHAHIQSAGLSGKVTVRVFDGHRLPYADHLVNLVVAEDLGELAIAEVMRVLCPGGVAYLKRGGTWEKTVKPWPDEMDEWTHYLHGPDNNAVAQDSIVGPPRQIQWIGKPRFSRSHDHLASVSAMVSAGGRLFYIVDLGSIAFAGSSPRWRLVARDAFNGVELWNREMSTWEYHLRDFRSGPADIARRLVAVGDRVYVTLGYGQPVAALDAATGETVHTYADTQGTQEILYRDGVLLLVLGEPNKNWQASKAKEIVSQTDYSPPFERYTPPSHRMRLMAVRAIDGQLIWKNTEPSTQDMLPSTLAASQDRVYFQNVDAVVCLDASTGQPRWKTPRAAHRQRLAWSTPTLVVHDGIVFSADRSAMETQGEVLWLPSGGYHQYIRGEEVRGELIAYNGETGERLWSCPAWEGFNAPVDVMIADGLLWTGRYAWGKDPGFSEARDPRTGEVRRSRPADQDFLPIGGHARCHRAKATDKYLILGRRGVEFVDLENGSFTANFWVRGICQYGVMPANGLVYVPPHSCACSVNLLLKSGLMALAPERNASAEGHEDSQAAESPATALCRGPAYGLAAPTGAADDAEQWPAYRHDLARSGATRSRVTHDLRISWQTDLGEQLTGPVIAEGVLLTAQINTHCIHALDATTGRKRWTYQTAGRIDSPPTIDRGRAVFGSSDGWVYCLRLTDGELIWQFRAAPHDRQIVVDEQLESMWPISGSVLVADGAVYFASGRSSYLDGAIRLYKLDAATGRILNVHELATGQEATKRGANSEGYLPDVLSTDGKSLFMRGTRFDLDLAKETDDVAHLWSSVGFLDDSWWHRTYWQIGASMGSGWGAWPKAGQQVPAGRLLVTDGAQVFGFGRNQYDTPGAHVGIDGDTVWGPVGREQGRWTFYQLFARTVDVEANKLSRRGEKSRTVGKTDWVRQVPVLAQAMILADNTLFVAGPRVAVDEIPFDPSATDRLAEASESTRGGLLIAVSTRNGETQAELALPSPPVFDGMASVQGRLYLATKLGSVVCMAPAQ